MTIIPLSNRVIIAFDEDPDAPAEKVGGVIVPAGFKAPTKEGAGFPYYPARVLAVGKECVHLKVGDHIAVNRNNVEKFSIGSETFWQVAEMAVAGIIAES